MSKFVRESNIVQPKRVIEKRKSVVNSFRPFQRDIYKRQLLTPHKEMEDIMDAFERNTFFVSAAETSKNFIIGEGIKFKSEDDFSKLQVEAYWKSLNAEMGFNDGVLKTVLLGNGYNEKDFYDLNKTNGILVPSKIYTIADASQIYINSDEYGNPLKKKIVSVDLLGNRIEKEVDNNEEYYIQKISENEHHPKAKYYMIGYYGSSGVYTGNQLRVYGIPIDKRKITHYKLSYGRSGVYGRSSFASALNDEEMLYQIERSIATIARYKAVPRKVWQYGDNAMPATGDELDEFMMYVESLDMEDDIIVNKPFATTDLSYNGKEMRLDYAINHIKKKMIAGVSLDFLSGMGQDVNRATAQQELLAFILSIYAKRKTFTKILQEEYIDPFIKWKKLKPVTIEFETLDFETKAEKETRIRSNWQSNMIKFNEMRKEMGLPEIDEKRDKEKTGEMLFSELQMANAPDFGGGFSDFGGGGFDQPPEEPDDNSLSDTLNSPRTEPEILRESVHTNPSGTLQYQNKLAIGIRQVYRQRLANVLDSLERNKRVIEKNIRTEAGIGINALETIMRAMHNTSPELNPLFASVMGTVWTKAMNDMSNNVGRPLVGGDIRIAQALYKNAFGFLEKHEEDMKTQLRMILTDGISQGDTINDISKEIKQSFGKTSAKSELIARTEVMRTYNQSALLTLQANGIKKYKWLTANDASVCPICKPRNHQIFETGKGPIPITNSHPNCRCSIVGIPNRESFSTKENFNKIINYDTLINSYKHVFDNPQETPIFYEIEEEPIKTCKLSFTYKNIMVNCFVTLKDLMKEREITEWTPEVEQNLWNTFEDNFLKYAVPEV